MKKTVRKPLMLILGAALLAPMALLAQPGEKEKSKAKKEGEQIIITRSGEGKEKVIIEVDGDNVTINGKPASEYKGDDVQIHRNKIKDFWAYGGNNRVFSAAPGQNFRTFSLDSNRALLGVSTDKNEQGAEVENVNEKSAAEKAGLKKGDIITKLNDKKISTPDDLSAAIKAQKPGDKVTITYLRDNKEQKATAELGKWEGHFFTTNGQNFDFKEFDINEFMPKIPEINFGDVYGGRIRASRGPRLGISVQDSEDGKGVNVIEVDEDSNGAKAGLKEGDVITDVDGKSVNSADEVAKIIKDSKDKISVPVKFKRNGKSQTVDVKIPRKLKTADL